MKQTIDNYKSTPNDIHISNSDAKHLNFKLKRLFSSPDIHPFDTIEWEMRQAEIISANGKVIFRQDNVEVPVFYSDLATRIVASKYFYGDADRGGDPAKGGREHSVKQLIGRVAATIASWGLDDGYFDGKEETKVFEDELTWLCLHQHGAFNSPVWFNLGLFQQYGVGQDSGIGNYYWDKEKDTVARAANQYEYPQCSACFIQSVRDDLDSIMDLALSEARLFKYGSGSGTDLSVLRSTREKLSGGGKPSGPLSFLEVYDSVAGVVKSGGKTRRAAKMNVLKDWHPDIEEFIQAKTNEEKKAWALIEEGYDPSFNGEAYGSIKFQNENLSVRASDAFMQAVEKDEPWWTRKVTSGERCEKKAARKLMRAIASGTHLCGDPGLQFDDTINRWHTCKSSGRQNCTNPCSEYLFIDDTACNLASLNLMKFLNNDGFDYERFAAAVKIFIIAQEILVDRSSYPTPAIAHNSHWFRTLGLGYANLGALLMHFGHGYDSDAGRDLAAGITAVMTGMAYRTSAELAVRKGVFPGYKDARCYGEDESLEPDNVESMQEVMRLHREHLSRIGPQCPGGLREYATNLWDEALEMGRTHGYRNAQTTVLAPTGTIAFLMDCDTTGIEPALGLVTYKQLAGGGLLSMPVRGIPTALGRLGYDSAEIESICKHVENYGTIENVEKPDGGMVCSGLKSEHLPVFDTAFASGIGKRSLSWMAHLKMMAAVQPFLSGGISKTVNMPHETTVEEIENAYLEAWRMGLKAVAIYRDGSKRSAPLSTRKKEKKEKEIQVVMEPYRRKLPDTRSSVTHKFSIGGTEGYFTVGIYEDGSPGEVFIQMSKAGSTINGLMDTIGTLLSLSLQHGVPLNTLVKKFAHVRFEPEGLTRNPDIPFAKSVMDYLVRWLGMEFIEGYREQMSPQARQESESIEDLAASGIAIEAEDESTRKRMDPQQLELLVQARGHLACPECGSSNVKVTGTCASCLNCGTSLGCS